MPKQEIFRPKHTVNELISGFAQNRINEALKRANEQNESAVKVPGLSEMLHGEGLVSIDPSGDLTEDGDEREEKKSI